MTSLENTRVAQGADGLCEDDAVPVRDPPERAKRSPYSRTTLASTQDDAQA